MGNNTKSWGYLVLTLLQLQSPMGGTHFKGRGCPGWRLGCVNSQWEGSEKGWSKRNLPKCGSLGESVALLWTHSIC